jgi:predicted AAA+ superfamily ATPase
MQKLVEKSLLKRNSVSMKFKRYLYNEIDWTSRLIGIEGARGTGKTTLMLQKLRRIPVSGDEGIYISLDDIYFSAHSLVEFTEQFVKHGGKYIFIDDLNELSLREYIALIHNIDIAVYNLSDIIKKHHDISAEIIRKVKPLVIFDEYIRYGAYPFINEGRAKYYERLETIVNLIIENDLQSVAGIEYQTMIRIKKLLYILAGIVPFKPNIAELSRKTGTSRDHLCRYLELLERADLILQLRSDNKSISYLAKPEKIYLRNPVLMYALGSGNANPGSIRETFFMNQLICGHDVTYANTGDFSVDSKYIFEVGGKNKTRQQIKGIKDSYIAADDIEYGFRDKIPLWLFGFLY